LVAQDERFYSTFGGLSLRDPKHKVWVPQSQIDGTEVSVRVGEWMLEFGNGVVRHDEQTFLSNPVGETTSDSSKHSVVSAFSVWSVVTVPTERPSPRLMDF
jgi:hypothetical protein